MKRSRINFIVDVLMFVTMMAAVGIGLLIEYVLIPGKQVPLRFGSDVELFLSGLDRHQWGLIHLVVGLVLLVLLVIHIVLHWNWLLTVYRAIITSSRKRRVVTPLFILTGLLLASWFMLVSPELRSFERGSGRGRSVSTTARGDSSGQDAEAVSVTLEATVDTVVPACNDESMLDINGRYTVGVISKKFNVPMPYVLQKLGLPTGTSSTAKLGRLRRMHGFKMSDVEKIIRQYQADH
jgi:uncharacterized protein DUF4405